MAMPVLALEVIPLRRPKRAASDAPILVTSTRTAAKLDKFQGCCSAGTCTLALNTPSSNCKRSDLGMLPVVAEAP